MGVDGEEDDTFQALVSPRMPGLTFTATAWLGCGVPIIGTSPIRSGLRVVSLQLQVLTLLWLCAPPVSVGCAAQLRQLTTVVPNLPCGCLSLPWVGF